MADVSLHHVHLVTDDVTSFCEFFEQHFGATVVYDAEIDGDRNVFMTIGTGRIHLFQSRKAPPRARNVFHHIGFMIDDLPDFVAELRSQGVEVSDITVTPGGGFAMAQGPDGLLMELFTVTEPESRRYFVTT
ncbi:VOC family protein [Gordonia sp. NPDC003376]